MINRTRPVTGIKTPPRIKHRRNTDGVNHFNCLIRVLSVFNPWPLSLGHIYSFTVFAVYRLRISAKILGVADELPRTVFGLGRPCC